MHAIDDPRRGPACALHDLTGEVAREYLYPDGATISIAMPSKLLAMPSGSHLVLDAMGNARRVRPGWIHVDVVDACGEANAPASEAPVAAPAP